MPDPSKAVFLSYARQDAAAAEKIADALRDAGIEVWFDQSELRGGDAWDAAIRRQIKTCALLIPIISANTQSRAEGYFRLEWKLAVDRSHLMSHDRAFLVPVVIDDTGEGDERVPDRFRELQWSRLPGGDTSTAFVKRVQRLLQPESTVSRPAGQTATARPTTREAAPASRRTARWLAAAVSGVALIGAGLWIARSLSRAPPVVAYSAEDRRMSFALLPLQAAPDDAHAVQVARATGEALQTVIEMRKELIALAARATTEQAAAHEDNPRRLAKVLNVHFLLRGSVARDGGGYAVTLVSIDGDSERTLNTQVLKVAPDAVKPRYRDDLLDAVYELMLPALGIEVRRARARPDGELDARDLSFRAWIDWSANRDADGKAANEAANALLTRALTLAPDDVYALRTSTIINLCDCVNGWSPDPEVQKAVGAASLERYLRIDPNSRVGLAEKASLYQLRERWEESMLIADAMLRQDPDMANALGVRATALMRLGRAKEAQSIADGLVVRYPSAWPTLALGADVYYALGDSARAAQLAQQAVVSMSDGDKRDRLTGSIQLTLIAAEGRLGHAARARTALQDFNALLPTLTTLTAIKRWMHPSADLADATSLYEGLRLAGIPD